MSVDLWWAYSPDFVTAQEIRELDELMALPVPPEFSLRFEDDEDANSADPCTNPLSEATTTTNPNPTSRSQDATD